VSRHVHEPIHSHAHLPQPAVADHLGCEAYGLFANRFREVLEYMVDGLTDAMAPLFPTLPEYLEAQDRS
jgi:hypothetical protein